MRLLLPSSSLRVPSIGRRSAAQHPQEDGLPLGGCSTDSRSSRDRKRRDRRMAAPRAPHAQGPQGRAAARGWRPGQRAAVLEESAVPRKQRPAPSCRRVGAAWLFEVSVLG